MKNLLDSMFSKFAAYASRLSGSASAFILIVCITVIWLLYGPYYHFSNEWQLWCNTASTILTTLMVFIIQNAQNRESKAIQIKLDELIRAKQQADNHLINIEELTEHQLETIREKYKKIKADLSCDILTRPEGKK